MHACTSAFVCTNICRSIGNHWDRPGFKAKPAGQTAETSQRRVMTETSRSSEIHAAASSNAEVEQLRRDDLFLKQKNDK